MEKKKNSELPSTFRLYDRALVSRYLSDLTVANRQVFGLSDEDENKTAVIDSSLAPSVRNLTVSESKTCSVCGIRFESLVEQREHFKLDWHRYNLKLKLSHHSRAVTEDEFERLISGKDDDVISISGSESSDDDDDEENEEEEEDKEEVDERSRHPFLYFQNPDKQILSLHKCVLTTEEEFGGKIRDFEDRKSAVFMLGGGHFAGAVFRGNDVVVHKTFHCYTVRRKQGGSQSSADGKGGRHPKSAGASLRRYNEMSLTQHVRDIVQSWKSELDECRTIFYRAASQNKKILFPSTIDSSSYPLHRKENAIRLRTIPFPTRRATFNEVKRVYAELMTVQLYNDDHRVKEVTKRAKNKNHRIRRSKSREKKIREFPQIVQDILQRDVDKTDDDDDDEEEEMELTTEIVELSTDHLAEFGFHIDKSSISSSKIDKNQVENDLVSACMSGHHSSMISILESRPDLINIGFGDTKLTPLHLAARHGHNGLIRTLLEMGGDPSTKDKLKRVPYQLCSQKTTRDSFRTFSGQFPDKYDYKAGQIPPPLSQEELELQSQKRAERKKTKRVAKKERERENRMKEEERKREEDEKTRFLNLSDREKRALAAERRMLALSESKVVVSTVRCFQCALDMTGKTPFQYEEYRFCSMPCLKNHKKGKM